MTHSQVSSAQVTGAVGAADWSLAAGEAMRLPIGPGHRDLHVTEGRLWLTRVGTPAKPAEDLWLQPGESVALESGSEWVIEGWSQASFQLLVPPSACRAWLAAHAGQANEMKLSASSLLRRASAWLSPAVA